MASMEGRHGTDQIVPIGRNDSRWEIAVVDSVDHEPVQGDGLGEIADSESTEWNEAIRVVWFVEQSGGVVGDEYLAAVSGRHDASCLVDAQCGIVAVDRPRPSGVEADPDEWLTFTRPRRGVEGALGCGDSFDCTVG